MALPAALAQSLLDKDWYTEDEYFAWNEQSPERWEFIPDGPPDALGRRMGSIRAMSGGTPDHSAIAAKAITALNNALDAAGKKTCRVFGSDLKINAADGRKTFLDVSVFCGPLSFHRKRTDTVTNPILVAEVLSPSTEGYDRGEKWTSYQTIPTLQHFLLLSVGQIRAELYTRQETGWQYAVYHGLDAQLPLSALGVTLTLADLYAQIDFEEG